MKLRTALLSCVTALLASLLLARVHPFGDAGLFAAAPPTHSTSIPPQVGAILSSKCADCHSNQVRVPLYGRFAPASWLMERDIVEARKHLDLSLWDTYEPEKKQTLQAKMLQQARSKQMPLPQYRAIHWGSTVTPAELIVLTEWTHTTDSVEASSNPAAGDAAAGRIVFEKRCVGCHALDQSHEGPKLRGVFGNPAASVPGFDYSPALKNAHIVWNDSTLNRWLADPDTFVPGNNMDFRVVKRQERKDLIRYLEETR